MIVSGGGIGTEFIVFLVGVFGGGGGCTFGAEVVGEGIFFAGKNQIGTLVGRGNIETGVK